MTDQEKAEDLRQWPDRRAMLRDAMKNSSLMRSMRPWYRRLLDWLLWSEQ